MDREISFLDSTTEVETADAGWLASGDGDSAELHATGYRPSTTGSTEAVFVRKLFAADAATGALPRIRDTVDVQFSMFGTSSTPSWPASGVHGAYIDDGARAMGVCIGTSLQWIDPYQGTVIAEIRAANPWQTLQFFLLRKVGSERWQLWQDGVLLSELGYEVAVGPSDITVGADATSFTAPRAAWGRIDVNGDGLAAWDHLEVGLNEALPHEHAARRAESAEFPPTIRNRWSEKWEAVSRAILGTSRETRYAIGGAHDAITAATLTFERVDFAGDVLPWLEDARWSSTGDEADITVVGDRILVEPGDQDTGFQFFPTTPARSGAAVLRVGAFFQLQRNDEVDTEGRVGPAILVHDEGKRICALLVRDPATQAYGWILSGGPMSEEVAGDHLLDPLGSVFYPVDPFRPHRVELYVVGMDGGGSGPGGSGGWGGDIEFGGGGGGPGSETYAAVDSRVLLLVDDVIVDDALYTTFPSSGIAFNVTIGVGDSGIVDTACWIWRGYAAVTYSDLQVRPPFTQALADSLVFVGGEERNDDLEVWSQHALGMEQRRGTYDGLRVEYRRIAHQDNVDIHQELTPASWFLDVSFPEVTPIFLDCPDYVNDLWIEFYATVPNYTPAAFCELVHRYIAPMSTLEQQWHCGLIVDVTEDVDTDADRSLLVVGSVDQFTVGDEVTVRQAFDYDAVTLEYLDTSTLAVDATWIEAGPTHQVLAGYRCNVQGSAALDITSSFTQVGKDNERTNTITAAAKVQIVCDTDDEEGTAIVIGLSAGGAAQTETITLTGTTPSVGTLTWSAVHGAFLVDALVSTTVEVQDNADNDVLYSIAPGQTGSGVLDLRRPGLVLPQPLPWTFVASGATVQKLTVAGVDEAGAFHIEVLTLNGTTPVTTSTSWTAVTGLGLGYVPVGRTLTVTTHAFDVSAVLSVVSSSASDVQGGYAVGLDRSLESTVLERFTLTGTTPVVLVNTGRVLAVLLDAAAVGTVSLKQQGGGTGTTTTFGTIAIAEDQWGARRFQMPTQDIVRLRTAGGSGYAAVFGYDENSVVAAEVLAVDSDRWLETTTRWTKLLAVGSTGLADTALLKLDARSWFGTWREAQAAIGASNTTWSLVGVDDDFKTWAVPQVFPPDQGFDDTGTYIRDVKDLPHSPGLGRYDLEKVTAIDTSFVTADTITGIPLLETTPSGADAIRFRLTGTPLTDFETLWASGTFSVFFRVRRILPGNAGIDHVIKANGGTSTTAEQVGIAGLSTLRFRYNGVDHNVSLSGKTDDTWYSACVVVTANVSQWYFDGAALGTTQNHGGAGTATQADFFRNIAGTDWFDFADLVLFRRALSAGELLALDADEDGDDALRVDSGVWAQYLDPQLGFLGAIAGAIINVRATYDVYEQATILTIGDPDPLDITVAPLENVYTAGAVVRLEIT